MSKLGILFDIEKLNDVIYGDAAWDIFWRAMGPEGLADGVRLYEGDTSATLAGAEQVFCLAIESADPKVLEAIRAKLAADSAYQAVAAGARFLDADAVEREPLPLIGHFEKGQIVGEHAINARAALAKLRRGSLPHQDGAPTDIPERLRPASPRSANLPPAADLERLMDVLGERFPGQGHSMRFSLTPEELCDVIETCAAVFDVYWHVGEATVAETCAFVNLMPKGRHDARLEFFGLMDFPSRQDALRYCVRESITPEEWGLHGSLVRNFVGLLDVQSASESLYRDQLASRIIRADELWSRICARRRDLNISGSTARGRKAWWRFRA